MTDTQTRETSSLHLKQIGTNSASTLPKDSFCLKYKEHIDACINLAKVEDPMEAPTVEKIINTRKTNKQPRKIRYDKRVPEYNSSGTINETMESITNIYTKDFIKPVTGCSVCAQIQRMPGFTMIRIISHKPLPGFGFLRPLQSLNQADGGRFHKHVPRLVANFADNSERLLQRRLLALLLQADIHACAMGGEAFAGCEEADSFGVV